MKKLCFIMAVFLSILLLMVSFSLAQTPREGKTSEGKTTFTNIAVVGLGKDGSDGKFAPGLPGYIEMVSTKGDIFYLYIGYDGNLRITSEVIIGLGASPTIISWGDATGPIVGSQHY